MQAGRKWVWEWVGDDPHEGWSMPSLFSVSVVRDLVLGSLYAVQSTMTAGRPSALPYLTSLYMRCREEGGYLCHRPPTTLKPALANASETALQPAPSFDSTNPTRLHDSISCFQPSARPISSGNPFIVATMTDCRVAGGA